MSYDNPFYADNVYGHVVSLLEKHNGKSGGLHIDIGCSFGRIAEHLALRLGVEYIGLDIDQVALQSLASRGFRTEFIDLGDINAAEAIIRKAIGGGSVASLSIIDTLEHIPNDDEVLSMLRRVALQYGAPLAMSVPNVAHKDIGFKLAFGKWDYTEAGLLDATHLRFFTESSVAEMMQRNGWHLIARNSVHIRKSDQHFPDLHPALAEGALLHSFFSELRTGADQTGTINQHVGIYLPGPQLESDGKGEECERPFLSVITRTQGRRLNTLRDVLLCLSAQTSQNFEVCVLGHKLSKELQLKVERVIEDTHESIRSRIRFIRVDDGNRTRPLNVGFAEARGSYVAILDDDDIVMGHWVEEFEKLAREHPGRVLRLANVAQVWQPVHTNHGSIDVRAIGSLEPCYPSEFDFFQHLIENKTPPVSLAFPRSAFADMGIAFDETLSTTEDWDFLMRTASVCGVASNQEITSIYRKWNNAESSYTVHSQEEWQSNHFAIWRKLDAAPLLLEPGSASRIRKLVSYWNHKNLEGASSRPDHASDEIAYMNALREQIYGMLDSNTWRASFLLRMLGSAVGRKYHPPRLWAMGARELEAYLQTLKSSRSWRFGTWLRKRIKR